MLNTKKIIAALLLLTSAQSFGQPLSLTDVLKEIESNNTSLKVYDSRIKSEDAKIEGSKAWMAPMVGAGTFMTPYPRKETIDDNDRGAFMISVEQDIPNPAKLKARKEYQKTQSLTYFYGKTDRFNSLRAQAREVYFDLLIDYKKVNYQQENLRIMQTMKKLADIRYPLNQGNLSQIFKAEGRAYEAENMLLMTKSDIRSKKIALNSMMNRNPAAALEIDTSSVVSFNPIANLDTLYFSETRSEVLHMQHDIHAMEANIKLMRQEAKPDFRLRFDNMANYSAMMPNQFTVMGMLSIPIAPWASKSYTSQLKSMNFEIEAMQLQKQDMLTQMLGMTKSMENEILATQQQASNYEKKILPALGKNLKVSMLSYQEIKADLTLVIDAWEALNMAQLN